MLREVEKHFEGPTSIEKVYFVLFDAEALSAFKKGLAEMTSKAAS